MSNRFKISRLKSKTRKLGSSGFRRNWKVSSDVSVIEKLWTLISRVCGRFVFHALWKTNTSRWYFTLGNLTALRNMHL
jgi:nuclear transport factor 2 (NTF2) superfamily protein